jgi:hypothetical protein
VSRTSHLTGETHFGIDLQSALSGAQAIPPEGVRVDVTFEGEFTGPKIKGTIAGTDYVLMRGDGVSRLHAHAVITTDDGERIAFHTRVNGRTTGMKDSKPRLWERGLGVSRQALFTGPGAL